MGRPPSDYTRCPDLLGHYRRPSRLAAFFNDPRNRSQRKALSCWAQEHARKRRGLPPLRRGDRRNILLSNKLADSEEFMRAALDCGFIRRDQIDPVEFPTLAERVCIDNEHARVVLQGGVTRAVNGKPNVEAFFLIITSKLDGATIYLSSLATAGGVLPYLRCLSAPIARHLPMLNALLQEQGLYAKIQSPKTKRVYVTRIVAALGGHSLVGNEVHHLRYDGEGLAGFGSLDCRFEHLTVLSEAEHRRRHQQLGIEHYHRERAAVGIGATQMDSEVPASRKSAHPRSDASRGCNPTWLPRVRRRVLDARTADPGRAPQRIAHRAPHHPHGLGSPRNRQAQGGSPWEPCRPPPFGGRLPVTVGWAVRMLARIRARSPRGACSLCRSSPLPHEGSSAARCGRRVASGPGRSSCWSRLPPVVLRRLPLSVQITHIHKTVLRCEQETRKGFHVAATHPAVHRRPAPYGVLERLALPD